MRFFNRHLVTLALGLAGLGLHASDYRALLDVARTTWAKKLHIGVVCKYNEQAGRIESLRKIAGEETVITVVDVHAEREWLAASHILARRRPDFLLLMPSGGFYGEGGFWSTVLVRALARLGVPSVGTSPRAIEQGAVFAVGEHTGYHLLVSERPIGNISVILPKQGQAFRQDQSSGAATLNLISAER
ncbi:MAG: hypothetical protein HY823_08790 [Acidobacteria bacterium]|nr:hypothetical protein [Acidobacteriota bacterium]